MDYDKILNIWVVGTSKEQLNTLDDSLYRKKFVTNDEIEGENINHLNRFLNEFVCQYYVWKNNIYSKYVAFCHYRRVIEVDSITLSKVREGAIQYFHCLFLDEPCFKTSYDYPLAARNTYMPSFMIDDIQEYLRHQKIIPQDSLKKFCTLNEDGYVRFPCRAMYACKWDIFCDMMSFIFGYIDFVSDKYGLRSKEDWIKHISNKVIAYHKSIGKEKIETFNDHSMDAMYQSKEEYLRIFDEDEGLNSYCNNWRLYAYTLEDLVAIYIGTHKRVSFKDINCGHVE